MIVVTGGNGFIGAHLIVRLLQLNQSVTAFIRPNSSKSFFYQLLRFYQLEHLQNLVIWKEVELEDPFGLELHLTGCNTVYHCAGKVDFSEKAWPQLLIANRNCTQHLINAALEAGVSKFCHFSSVAALDMSEGIKGKKTDWKHFKKHQPYGYSKYLGELEACRGYEEGLKVLILNPAVVVGPSPTNHPLQKFLSKIGSGIPYYPIGSTGFVGVDTLVNFAITQTAALTEKRKITVASHNISFKELIQLFCEEAKVKPPSKPLNGLLLQFLYGIARTKLSSTLNMAGLKAISTHSTYEVVSEIKGDLRPIIASSLAFSAFH